MDFRIFLLLEICFTSFFNYHLGTSDRRIIDIQCDPFFPQKCFTSQNLLFRANASFQNVPSTAKDLGALYHFVLSIFCTRREYFNVSDVTKTPIYVQRVISAKFAHTDDFQCVCTVQNTQHFIISKHIVRTWKGRVISATVMN